MRTPRIGVVVPAHDEQELLPACLAALRSAVERVGFERAGDERFGDESVGFERAVAPVEVVLVADNCADDTYQIGLRAQQAGFRQLSLIEVSARNVGVARAAGFQWLLARAGRDVSGLWLATTDADSEVPADWLVRQLSHFARGAEAVVGTVRIADWSEPGEFTKRRYDGLYSAVDGHRHTHGANLGFSAAAYLAAGGFAARSSDEDVALVRAIEATGAPMVWTADLPVTTSGRLTGRAPSGFAGYLSELAE